MRRTINYKLEDYLIILLGGLPTALYVAFSVGIEAGIVIFGMFLIGYCLGKEN